jgi:RNA polymerase sigma factor (sigma-70 family)
VSDEDVQSLLRKRLCTAAFELLLGRYQGKVFRLVYSILKEASRAEEVTQDIFVKMWQVLPDYDGRASLSTWLYTISQNTALSALRADSYRKTLSIKDCEPRAINPEAGIQQLQIKQLGIHRGSRPVGPTSRAACGRLWTSLASNRRTCGHSWR